MKRTLYVMGLIGCVVFKIHAQQIQLITPKLIDFGKIQEASPVQGEILFLNSGSETLNINRIRTSCGCTATEIEKNVYAPGDTERAIDAFESEPVSYPART